MDFPAQGFELSSWKAKLLIYSSSKVPIIDVAYTLGETHQENPLIYLFVSSFIHSPFTEHPLYARHYTDKVGNKADSGSCPHCCGWARH